MDYDDLLLQWGRLIREFPDQRAMQGRMFRHLLIDEMQDTNAVQVAVVESVAAAGAGQPHGRRRRRPVDLPVPRGRLRQHPPIRRAAPRCPDLPPRDQLSIDAPDRRVHAGLDRPQSAPGFPRSWSRRGPTASCRWSSRPRMLTTSPRSSASRSSRSATRGGRSGRWPSSTAIITTASCSRASCCRGASPTRCGAACGSSSRRTSRTCWPICGSWSIPATRPHGAGCCS